MQNEDKALHRPGMLQAIVLTGWIAFFWWLARGTGDDALLGRFIRNDYSWLVYTGLAVFIALVASVVVRPPHWLGSDRFKRSLIQAIILALPILYLPLAVTSELSTAAAEKRSVYTTRLAAPRPNVPEPARTEPKARTAADNSRSLKALEKPSDPTMLDLLADPDAFEGSDVTMVGMAYKDKKLPADSFFLYRLMMVCCAADATPVGLIVKWPESRKLKKGTWVKVSGKVGFTSFDGNSEPAISAISVEKTSPPKKRFLVPQY